MWFNKIKTKTMLKTKITKRDIVWMLILLNVIIWAISYNKCKEFYNHYMELEIKAASAESLKVELQQVKENKKLSIEEQIIKIAAEEKFAMPDLLLRIAKCESGFDPYAVGINKNGTRDLGLFQFNTIHNLGEKPFDVDWATREAIKWIRDGKLDAWNSSKKCWSK